jgi:hypothetical protein
MMHIAKREQGWTVVNHAEQVMLTDENGLPLFLETREAVKSQCMQQHLYEVKEGNPASWPAGTLVSLSMHPI